MHPLRRSGAVYRRGSPLPGIRFSALPGLAMSCTFTPSLQARRDALRRCASARDGRRGRSARRSSVFGCARALAGHVNNDFALLPPVREDGRPLHSLLAGHRELERPGWGRQTLIRAPGVRCPRHSPSGGDPTFSRIRRKICGHSGKIGPAGWCSASPGQRSGEFAALVARI